MYLEQEFLTHSLNGDLGPTPITSLPCSRNLRNNGEKSESPVASTIHCTCESSATSIVSTVILMSVEFLPLTGWNVCTSSKPFSLSVDCSETSSRDDHLPYALRTTICPRGKSSSISDCTPLFLTQLVRFSASIKIAMWFMNQYIAIEYLKPCRKILQFSVFPQMS